MDALAFLEKPPKKLQPCYAVFGEEEFLRRQVILAIRSAVFAGAEDDFGLSTQGGDAADWANIVAELETLPFLGGQRLVIVENADPFVTRARVHLEKYLSQPAKTGILVLDLKSFPSNTRLAKALPADAAIACKALPPARVGEWCRRWSESHYGKSITTPAARLLADLVGSELGLLDQELAKLTVYVGPGPAIDVADVDQLTGNNREANTFKIFDAIASGDTKEALRIMDQVLDQGDDALKALGAFSYQLRKLVQASRLHEAGMPIQTALDRAGIVPFARARSEAQIRHLGRARINQLYDWLIEADQALKSSAQLPERLVLERFIVRMARNEKRLGIKSAL